MTKQAIIKSLSEKYEDFVQFIDALTTEDYLHRTEGKWAAEQQLEHIILCVKPLVQVFGMNKEVIGQSFGRTDKESSSYEGLLHAYLGKLTAGGKAPERFIPDPTSSKSKNVQTTFLTNLIKELCLKIDTFSENELDTLLIPHPLLKNITLREMLYNATYHVGHHQNQIIQNLQSPE